METKANISFHARAFAQVISSALFLLDCLYCALGYLSGMLFRVLVRMEALVTVLFDFLTGMAEGLLQVTERKAVKGFAPRNVHNRKHGLFTGDAK